METNEREKRWHTDMDAYRSLRKQGLQPRQIDGADHLAATATDPMEVEMGRKLPGSPKEIREGIQRAREIMDEAS